MQTSHENINILSQKTLISPAKLKEQLPLSAVAGDTVLKSRGIIRDILERRDPRLLLIVGPCSVHDPAAAMEYAQKLRRLAEITSDVFHLVMRVYFEKPRTVTGWKGMINDPMIDDSFQIEEGLARARSLLCAINELGLPAATEALDPIVPQYLQDLIAWSAIGARTTESQTHREMASGLSSIVGFKNGTDGGLSVAINALKSCANPHSFLGIDSAGQVAITQTGGNPYAHIVLRGGNNGPNYDAMNVALVERELKKSGLNENIVIDCSHANSNKEAELQPLVFDNVCNQILQGNRSIIGLMLESNLFAGNQTIPADLRDLKYGVSLTDACIGWEMTEEILLRGRERFIEKGLREARC